jgi:hypothetical protein
VKHPIAQTHNGAAVYVNLIGSAAATHIASQPHLLNLVKEALGKMSPRAIEVRTEQDMGRDIGYDFVAETNENDGVFYAKLLREENFTRFVKNGKARATSYLTLILHRDENGDYELRDTWIGRLSPPLPGSAEETPDSKPYWNAHAHIFDKQPIQARTITRVSPY